MTYEMKYSTTKKITVPKLFGSNLFGNIITETPKAILLVNVVQEKASLQLNQRWIAKSIIKELKEENHNWSYNYDHLINGSPALITNHKEV